MSETFETLKVKLGTWLRVNTSRLPDAVRGDMINLAQRELLRDNDLWFGEYTDTFMTLQGQRDYAKPPGWSKPFTLFYNDGVYTPLSMLDPDIFDSRYHASSTGGRPAHYALWGPHIRLGPAPDAAYTITRNYYRTLPDLTDGAPGNTNPFIDQAWEAIFFAALCSVTLYTLEDPRLPLWQGEAARTKEQLVREHRLERSYSRGSAQARIP